MKVEPELDFLDSADDAPPELTPNSTAVENGFDSGNAYCFMFLHLQVVLCRM